MENIFNWKTKNVLTPRLSSSYKMPWKCTDHCTANPFRGGVISLFYNYSQRFIQRMITILFYMIGNH